MRLVLAVCACVIMFAVSLGSASANAFLTAGWPDTNFDKRTVELSEIRSGGPGKDGIPAVWEPRFYKVPSETNIDPREPVLTVEFSGQTPRAYPIRYFMVHEIVNDVIGGVPIAVTFCPLCNSGAVFDRRVNGQTLSFGVSGNLRKSDMVMYDRETQSWWQQAIGQAIVGDLAGAKLKHLPSWMESWGDFKTRNPDALVLAPPNPRFGYGSNPYINYDSSRRPFLFSGELPVNGVDPMERVVRVGDTAWPLTRIGREKVIEEKGLRLSWEGEQASALDSAKISKGKSVETVRVRDAATGKDVAHDVMFAFAFHAFWPDGTWRLN